MNKHFVAVAALALASLPAYSATLQATYLFGGNLNAQQAGAPALIATDPLGLNGFVTDSVGGQSQQVYYFDGNASSPTQQGGLSFDNSGGLLTSNNYSVELLFSFVQTAAVWRRIIDVQGRASDNGFYVDPSNQLDVYPVGAGPATYTAGPYHDVILTDANNGTVKGYLDGVLDFTLATTEMDINNPNSLINLFLDNTAGGGIGEYSSGNIALARFFDGVLTDQEAAALAGAATGTPEPATWGLLAVGFGVIARLRGLQRRAS